MSLLKIAAVQMDCELGAVVGNRNRIGRKLHEAAEQHARLAVFPECALTGYAFESKEAALPFAESIPGPTTDWLAGVCRKLDIWAAVGMLELAGAKLFNVCVLVGPEGFSAVYRKIHLPFLGVDRFTTPGDQPFAWIRSRQLGGRMAVRRHGLQFYRFSDLEFKCGDRDGASPSWPISYGYAVKRRAK